MSSNRSYTRFDLEMERDQYFQIMAACLIKRVTIDEFIISAVMNLIGEKTQALVKDLDLYEVDPDLNETQDEEQEGIFIDEGNPNI